MPIIKDETQIKRPTQFLEYETGDGGNQLMLKSHLYQIDSHFLNSVSRSVACKDDECMYCSANYQKRSEYNYMVYLNGSVGFIDIKPSVFFAIQSVCKAQGKDPRQISWTVIKKGEGLKTKYTVSKDDNLTPDDYKSVQEELDANTDKLVTVMERHEDDLNTNYALYLKDIRDQKKPKVQTSEPEPEAVAEVIEPDQEVDPDKIPF